MGMDRRSFLKVAGLSTLLAAGGKAAVDILAPGDLEASMKLMARQNAPWPSMK